MISRTRFSLLIWPKGDRSEVGGAVNYAIALVLVVAVLLQGIREGLDVPGAVELIAEVLAGALLLWIAWLVVRTRRLIVVPYLVLAFGVLIVICAVNADELSRMLVSAKNFLFLPLVALAIATLGPSEERVRLVVMTTLALVGIEYVVTIGQSLNGANVDLIVGTFGAYAGPSVGLAFAIGTCLALGAYVRSGQIAWLAVAVALPLAAVWTVVRLMLIVVPLSGLTVAAAAWWVQRRGGDASGSTRAPLVVAITVVVTFAAMVGAYAIWRPSDLGVLTDSDSRAVYLEEADVIATPIPEAPAVEEVVDVPGRKVQAETAIRLVSESPKTFLIGRGLGATTYAENLGIEVPEDQDLVDAGYMDAGTVLVELGWLGVALVALATVALGLGTLAAARRAPPGGWTMGLLIAYPGILVAAVIGLTGAPLRNMGSATIFWVLTGLVLASVLQPSRSSAEAPR